MLIGYGYLGHAITRLFRDKGWETQTASLSGTDGSLACCLSDDAAVDALPDADLVIHCASSGESDDRRSYQRVYVDGCRNLVRRYRGVPILFTSSSSVYGQAHGEIVTENCPAEPCRERGELLLMAEHHIVNAGGTVARLTGLYGPGRSKLLESFLSGEARIEGDGLRYLNHIHRDDAAEAILHLVEHGLTGIYNVTDSHPMHQIDCYRDLAWLLHKPMPPRVEIPAVAQRDWTNKRVSNAKLRATGWEPEYLSYVESMQGIVNTLQPG